VRNYEQNRFSVLEKGQNSTTANNVHLQVTPGFVRFADVKRNEPNPSAVTSNPLY